MAQPFRRGGPLQLNRDGLFRIALDRLCGTAIQPIGDVHQGLNGDVRFVLLQISFFQTATASTSLRTCSATSFAVCCNRVFAALTDPDFHAASPFTAMHLYAQSKHQHDRPTSPTDAQKITPVTMIFLQSSTYF